MTAGPPRGRGAPRASRRASAATAVLAAALSWGPAVAPEPSAKTGMLPVADWRWFSQYGQDRFVYERFFASRIARAAGGVAGRRGVFVELGAADGTDKSNTLAFEHNFGWTGVLIEPSVELFAKLNKSRPSSIRLHDCVSPTAGNYSFTEDGLNSGLAMTLGGMQMEGFAPAGGDRRWCRTLPEILHEHLGKSPHIDYLSLDLEGGELGVLQSLDFKNITVDVITVEAHNWENKERNKRMTKLLERSGYLFVERIGADEVWVRRRSVFGPDPGCLHPGVALARRLGSSEAPGKEGWSGVRDSMWWFYRMSSARFRGEAVSSTTPHPHNKTLLALVDLWEGGYADALDSECPVGALATGLAIQMSFSRHNGKFLYGLELTGELKSQSIFYATPVLKQILNGYDHASSVAAAEAAQADFEVRFPISRSWHEVPFLEVLESGWPIFGLLDLVSRAVGTHGHLLENIDMNGFTYQFPMRMPKPPCQLERSPASFGRQLGKFESPVHLAFKSVDKPRSSWAPTSDLVMDAEACGVLGTAVARFHEAKAEFDHRRLATASAQTTHESWPWGRYSEVDRYVPLANWSAAGCGPRPGRRRGAAAAAAAAAPPLAEGRCSGLPQEACALLDEASRPLPRECLRRLLPERGGRSLRLRRRPPLSHTRVGQLVEEGERLLRAFVVKHGLLVTVLTLSMPELTLVPPRPASASKEVPKEYGVAAGAGESALAVLHSLQVALLAHEGLS